MAIFYLQISSVGRGAGRRATAAAAYRAGERVRDERTGELHNFSRRRDVLHTEIFLPAQPGAQAAEWARSRERLWNTAEHAEKRHNARVAREFQVNLPAELPPLARIALARSFALELAERYRVAVDLAVHAPRPDSDPRNFHAHLLATTREVTPAGLGAKAGLDMEPRERRQRQLPDHRQEFINVRERWAVLTNEARADAPMLSDSDPTAQSLGYKPDATQIDKAKYPKYQAGQACANCQLYQGKPGDAAGPCPIFGGKQVSVKGWCSAYVKKA